MSILPKRGASERWTKEQVRFVEEARAAARRALYSVRLRRGLPEGAERLRHDALAQVRAVHLPADDVVLPREPRESRPDSHPFIGALEPLEALKTKWAALRDTLEAARPSDAEAGASGWYYERLVAADRQINDFVKHSAPEGWWLSTTYVLVPAVLALVRRHAGFLIGLGIALGTMGLVEIVRGLILNDPSVFGFALFFLIAPVAINFAGQHFLGRRLDAINSGAADPTALKGVLPWDVGGYVYRSLRPYAEQPPPWVKRHPDDGYITRAWLGFLLAIVILIVIWTLGGVGVSYWRPSDVNAIGVTTFTILAALAMLPLLGSFFDFVDFHSRPPVRRGLFIGWGLYLLIGLFLDEPLVAFVFLAGWMILVLWWAKRVGYASIGWFFGAVLGTSALVLLWTNVRRGTQVWREDLASPVALIQENAWPYGGDAGPPVVVVAASGGGSRAAVYTGLTLEALTDSVPQVANNIHAISSVSGGSLANAAYVAERMGVQVPERCAGDLSDRLSADYLWPVLRGVVRGGRGMGIENRWIECPGLGSMTIGGVAEGWLTERSGPPGQPPFPVPLFNSVNLLRHAVVISPLAPEVYRSGPLEDLAKGPSNAYLRQGDADPTWVYYRSGMYALSELLPNHDPKLASAVRASANFPFGFALVDVATDSALFLSPHRDDRLPNVEKRLRLTDGGALSNSGMWSLQRLLLARREALRARGVLLVVVDASRMPATARPTRFTGLASAIADKNPKSEALHRLMFEDLQREFGACIRIVQLEIQPERRMNVLTTWALGAEALERVEAAFWNDWNGTDGDVPGDAARIRAGWDGLQGCDPDAPGRHDALVRVPLS